MVAVLELLRLHCVTQMACGCPLYWKGPLFYGAGGERTGSVSVHKFVAMWRKILQNCHDEAAKFVHLLMNPGCNYLVQEDFVPFLQDVVNTHPGLSFLKEASEFHSRYITTVIQRIFYTVNRSWTGRITCTELRRSTFLQNVALLEEEADINQLTEYFSYEHFYVIYCKFWELDTDHDLLIDAQDLARHNDHGEPGCRTTLPLSLRCCRDTGSLCRRATLQDWPQPFAPSLVARPLTQLTGHASCILVTARPAPVPWFVSEEPQEYDLLVAEEAAGEPWDDGYEGELSPVDQKLSALRSPLAQRPFFEVPTPLGDVDLYEYACGDDDLQPL
ncbi:protein phosphatase 2 regulatory subunit B''beta [Ictidomys tridecemlineatus]|nr:protein phosphatase 2 regulatory subunit B''beta [Ictidomys tridecemlineatus]